MTLIALSMVVIQFIFASKLNIIQFLSLSFEGPAKWFFLGIIFYLIIIVAIAVTAIFYIHLEVNLKRKISGILTPLATILMIFAGLSGSGIISIFTEGKIGQQNVEILNTLIAPISISIGILSIGVICRGLTYTLTYIKGKK